MSLLLTESVYMPWPFRSSRSAPAGAAEADIQPEDDARAQRRAKYARWDFEAGAPIAPGRTVLERLGGGSAYQVFVVWDERLLALVVAKVLRPDRVEDERSLRDLRREARLLERLAHPSLVRGFGAVLEGPHPHVLLELVEGPTLGRLIKREGSLALAQLLPIALQIAGVVHYLSLENVVHLDIKPSNIVMSTTPRLIDLSIARSLDRAARLKSAIGTDPYMAPEQCDPKTWLGRIGTAADVWGLGATLYHATSGKLPFPRPSAWDEDDLHARYPQILDQPEPLPKRLPSSLTELIGQMLSKDPQDRPAPADIAGSLESLVGKITKRRRRRARRMGR